MVGTLYRYGCRNGKTFISKEGTSCRKIKSYARINPLLWESFGHANFFIHKCISN